MLTHLTPILVHLAPAERAFVDRLLDAALRHAGLNLAEPIVDVIRVMRQTDAEGRFVLSPRDVATLGQVADAACRARGLELAEHALAFLNRLRESPPWEPPTPPAEDVAPPQLELVDEAPVAGEASG